MKDPEAQAEGVQQPTEEINQLGALCQVEGCAADLLSEKRYCLKKKICSQHMQSDVVHKRGLPEQQWRFCFQCGKLEPLERFDGKQRSCRTRLELRRKPKRSNSSLDAPRQQEPASPSGRKAKRSRRSNRSSSCAQDTDAPDAGSGQWDQDQSLMQAVMWQFARTNNGGCAVDEGACDFSSCGGYTADSCQGDAAAAVTAAAASARPQQSCGAVRAEAAAVQAAAGFSRTTTAVSANAVAVLLSEQVSAFKPVPPAAPAAAPATAGYNLEDLNSPRALRGHMASLQKQCQVLQSQLAQQRQQQQQQSASGCRPAASAAAGFARPAAVPAASSRGLAAVMQPPVLSAGATPALQQQQQKMALQRHGSRETPSSPDESAMTAVTTVAHMDLVEMVVAQLDDSTTSAAADELEAMLKHELRAAASLPPEHAKNTWASQLNDVINDWSSVISSAAMPPFGGCFARAADAACAAGAAPFGGLLARQTGADVWGMGAGLTASQGAMPPAPVASAGKKAFDLKLMTLQQQLSDLQGLVYNLRAQFTS